MAYGVKVDSFSGTASDLRGKQRTAENVLIALRRDSRVSTWDMSEHVWLRDAIAMLKRQGKIVEDEKEPYPWHRYNIAAEPNA